MNVQYVDESGLYSYKTSVPSWPMQVCRLDSGEAPVLGFLESATWAKLEHDPVTNPKANKCGSEWGQGCVDGKALLICGQLGLNCHGVPRPAFFWWIQKSQPEMDIDSQNLTSVFPKFKVAPTDRKEQESSSMHRLVTITHCNFLFCGRIKSFFLKLHEIIV